MEEKEQEAASVGDARGKHRILAELGRVEQEVIFLEVRFFFLIHTCSIDVSRSLSQIIELWLLCVIEEAPDPLLPLTKGPLNLGWDRWFEGPNGGEGCICFIL
ncbi:hypothetical protein DY000_02031819 [Brassica cretica]|uniref:G protein gamma domain-containing protein n=1 Tax=Brassica cretica TaxID=69181 RepID=A0ABQ7DC20_BRACR|nr:hypothetical protein DY000_02031819 [Brassica cretica]